MPFDPTQHLGETVTFRGTAHTGRGGAIVMVPDSPPVYVSGLTEWADDVAGKQVEVTGRLRARPSRTPRVVEGGEQYHGVGATIALDDARWTVVD
jgi:hypothetical protein